MGLGRGAERQAELAVPMCKSAPAHRRRDPGADHVSNGVDYNLKANTYIVRVCLSRTIEADIEVMRW